MFNSRFDKYVVEARLKDGSLNVKHYDKNEPMSFITGISANELFDFYFRHNDGIESATQEDIIKWFGNRGEIIRRKYW